jgi:hypothetical protein
MVFLRDDPARQDEDLLAVRKDFCASDKMVFADVSLV